MYRAWHKKAAQKKDGFLSHSFGPKQFELVFTSGLCLCIFFLLDWPYFTFQCLPKICILPNILGNHLKDHLTIEAFADSLIWTLLPLFTISILFVTLMMLSFLTWIRVAFKLLFIFQKNLEFSPRCFLGDMELDLILEGLRIT